MDMRLLVMRPTVTKPMVISPMPTALIATNTICPDTTGPRLTSMTQHITEQPEVTALRRDTTNGVLFTIKQTNFIKRNYTCMAKRRPTTKSKSLLLT